ncbi:MAG: hypothetical protein ABII01_04350 [Candidatus Woesearchaeota archaeon]
MGFDDIDLEKIVVSESKKRRALKRAAHYTGLISNAIYNSATFPFMMPTRIRKWVTRDISDVTFMDDVYRQTVYRLAIPVTLAAMTIEPKYGIAASVTNLISLGYEILRLPCKAFVQPHWEAFKAFLKPGSLDQRLTNADNYYRNLGKSVVDWVKGAPRKSIDSFERLQRRVEIFTVSFMLASILCYGHYSARPEEDQTFYPDKVNISATQCTLEHEGHKSEMILVGESHIYNRSSSIAAERLLDSIEIDCMLSEGLNKRMPNPLLKPFIYSRRVLQAGMNYNSPPMEVLCENRDIPVYWLESFSAVGTYEGISWETINLMAKMGVFQITNAPSLYSMGLFTSNSFSSGNAEDEIARIKKVFERPGFESFSRMFDEILDDRNVILVDEIMHHISGDKPCPYPVHLIRVGGWHKPGMYKLFPEYGIFTHKELEIPLPTHSGADMFYFVDNSK